MDQKPSSRTLLTRAALKLFRRHGYAGVGISEILAETGLPKGSLYHHFPQGKKQLAQEAVLLANRVILDTVEDSFVSASTFNNGATLLCRAVAAMAQDGTCIAGCPVLGTLQADNGEPYLQKLAAEIVAGWTEEVLKHAIRFGLDSPDDAASMLVMKIEGAWLLAKVQQSMTPFRILERDLNR